MSARTISEKISSLFEADSIVLIGASANPRSLGFQIARSLIQHFQGQVYYVSATEAKVLGSTTYETLSDVPAGHHLWIVTSLTKNFPNTLHKIGTLQPLAILLLLEIPEPIYSAAKKVITKLSCPVIGPRSAGYYYSGNNFDILTLPTEMLPRPTAGAAGVVTDNRDVAFGLLEQLSKYRCGVSHFIDLGETLGITETDILNFLTTDPETRVILFGCGQIANLTKFKTAIKRAHHAKKPIIVSLFPPNITEQLGLHRRTSPKINPVTKELSAQHQLMITPSWGRAVDLALLCQKQPLPQGTGVAAISNFGAYCVYAADALHGSQLELAHFAPETQHLLQETLPPYSRSENPICIYTNADEERLDATLRIILPDPSVHSLLISLLPDSPYIDPDYLNVMLRQRLKSTSESKTIVAMIPAVERDNLLIKSLEQLGIPVFSNTHRAVTTLQNAYHLTYLLSTKK